MLISRKSQWIIFCCVNSAVLLLVALFPFYLALASVLPVGECGLVDFAGLYCPACGGTRALTALLQLQPLKSLYYNPIVLVAALLFLGYEAFMVLHLIKGTKRDVFIKPKAIYVILALWLIYALVRNVLLVFGIDVIGDIL